MTHTIRTHPYLIGLAIGALILIVWGATAAYGTNNQDTAEPAPTVTITTTPTTTPTTCLDALNAADQMIDAYRDTITTTAHHMRSDATLFRALADNPNDVAALNQYAQDQTDTQEEIDAITARVEANQYAQLRAACQTSN